MDRSLRIPDEIINRLLTGLDTSYWQKISVGYPLPTDVDTNWAFPVFLQVKDESYFPVLGLQQHFAYYGAIMYDVTLSSLANQTSLAYYLITPKNLAQQPLPLSLQEPDPEEDEEEGDDDDESMG